jgi:hypothetical protein
MQAGERVITVPQGPQLVNEIGTKFQRLPLFFGIRQLNGTSETVVQPNWKSEIQYGGPQTRTAYCLRLNSFHTWCHITDICSASIIAVFDRIVFFFFRCNFLRNKFIFITIRTWTLIKSIYGLASMVFRALLAETRLAISRRHMILFTIFLLRLSHEFQSNVAICKYFAYT